MLFFVRVLVGCRLMVVFGDRLAVCMLLGGGTGVLALEHGTKNVSGLTVQNYFVPAVFFPEHLDGRASGYFGYRMELLAWTLSEINAPVGIV